jgi:hypothetical protein
MFSFGAAVEAALLKMIYSWRGISGRKAMSLLVLLARCARRECELAHKPKQKDCPKAVSLRDGVAMSRQASRFDDSLS